MDIRIYYKSDAIYIYVYDLPPFAQKITLDLLICAPFRQQVRYNSDLSSVRATLHGRSQFLKSPGVSMNIIRRKQMEEALKKSFKPLK